MYAILIYTMIFIGLIIIILILSQPSKQQDPLSLLSGDNNNILFDNQKEKSANIILRHITAFLGVIWILLGIILTTLT